MYIHIFVILIKYLYLRLWKGYFLEKQIYIIILSINIISQINKLLFHTCMLYGVHICYKVQTQLISVS